jgi:hypothetical protein
LLLSPRKGGKSVRKKFAKVEEAIAFINSFNSQPPNKACTGRVARVRPVKPKSGWGNPPVTQNR